MNNTKNPVEAKVATLTTKMILDCLAIFATKGYKNLTEDEYMVEGAMVMELYDRGFEKLADAHVEKM